MGDWDRDGSQEQTRGISRTRRGGSRVLEQVKKARGEGDPRLLNWKPVDSERELVFLLYLLLFLLHFFLLGLRLLGFMSHVFLAP